MHHLIVYALGVVGLFLVIGGLSGGLALAQEVSVGLRRRIDYEG